MPKFFINQDSIKGKGISITGEDAYHLCKVLRMRPGEVVEVSDGGGHLFTVRLTALAGDLVEGEIIGKRRDRAEPGLRIHLFQSILKGEKMDWVLQKATEIGAASFHPFLSARTVSGKDPSYYEKKRLRWQRIVLEAAKQSGRGRIPAVEPVVAAAELKSVLPSSPLEACRENPEGGISLVAWEAEETTSLKQFLQGRPQVKEVSVIIGPEGGFSSTEIAIFAEWGIKPVSLGPRILRAETAGPVITALLLYNYDEMEPVSS